MYDFDRAYCNVISILVEAMMKVKMIVNTHSKNIGGGRGEG